MTGDDALRLTTPLDMALYLSGKGSSHRNPTMLCSGEGFRVTTPLGVRQFGPSQFDEACLYLRLMLEEMDYH